MTDYEASSSTKGMTEFMAEIVSAYVSNNNVQAGDIAALIQSVHSALHGLGTSKAPAPEKLFPPVSVRKSMGDDYLISMEDGRRYKSLKRHLSGRGLTPAQYREKWGLPADYPMVAPSYARQRSELAKALGLGQRRKEALADGASAPKRGGRKKAA